MDKEPFSHCNLDELPNSPILPSFHIFIDIIHINQNPLSLSTTMHIKSQEVKSGSINKLVPTKIIQSSMDVQKYKNPTTIYQDPKQDTLVIPSPIIQEEIS